MSSVQTVLIAMKATPWRTEITEALADGSVKVLVDETLKETLESLRYKRPDLVLASLDLADVQGTEIIEKIRGDVRGALLPLLVMSQKADTSLKVKLFDLGVDDVLLDGVSREEIAAHARMMLKRFRKLGAALPDAESVDRRKITFLQQWSRDPSEKLKPVPCVQSHLGYTYEKAREHFACAPGAEVEPLEDLATRMCLERSFFDRVNLCPQCGHHAVSFRKISPKSKSPDISRIEMLRHFKCGHTAPVKEFVAGLDYVCPKCRAPLLHVAGDYERLEEMYIDNETGETFAKPDVDCVCLACNYVTDPDHLAVRNVYTYAISERGLLAAETGYLYEVSLDAVLMDYDLQIYNPSYFQRLLGIEIERSRRYRHHLGVAIVRLDQYESFLEQYGTESKKYLARVAETLKRTIRSSDIIARHERNSIVMLFPETDLEGTRNACEKLRNEVLKLKAARPDIQLTISCGVSGYPDGAEDQQSLVKSAAECFAKAQAMGGNVVVRANAIAPAPR
jgi:diguanylate cyclase (GGDEF)-like protein